MGFLPLPAATSWLRCLFLGLSVFVVPSPGRLQVPTPPGLRVLEALEGSEVVLPAWYTVTEEGVGYHSWELLSAIWFQQYHGKEPEQVLAYIKGATVNDEDTASLVYPMPSQNVSLRLRGLQEENSGLYFCSVNVQDHQNQRKDYAKSKTLELNVLVPPARPSCRVVGVPQVGTNVSLSCKSPRSKPAALYEWVRQPPNPQAFFPPVLDTYRGYLNLSNLTPSMSGVYTCKVQNRVGSSTCNVTLEVSTGAGPTVVTGAVMGTLLGLVLLAGLVLLFWRRRGQAKGMEEQANDIKEDAAAPRTLPWPKGSDTISKNGTLSSVTSARALRSPAGPARPGTMTPTPSLSSQALSSPRLPGTNRTPPQPAAPGQSGLSSMLSRMGAVPVMVPSQSQAGSLV